MLKATNHNAADPTCHASSAGTCDKDSAAPPTRSKLVFRSVYTPVWSSGVLLGVCFCLPVFLTRGCNSVRTEYPYEWFQGIDSVRELFHALLKGWPYLFGVMAALGTLLIALTRNQRHFRTLWTVYAWAIGVTVLGLWYSQGKDFRSGEAEAGLEAWFAELWVLVPTACLLAAILVTYFNCRTWFSAVLWVQILLAVISTAWFVLLAVAYKEDLLIGGKLSLGASFVLLASTALERLCGLGALGLRMPARRAARSHAPALAAPPIPSPTHAPA